MIYQILALLTLAWSVNFIPLEAVELQEPVVHFGNILNVGGKHTTFISNVSRDVFVVFVNFLLPVELASPSAELSPKMIESVQPFSGSGIVFIGDVPFGGEVMGYESGKDGADKAATKEGQNDGDPIWIVRVAHDVWFCIKWILIGGAIMAVMSVPFYYVALWIGDWISRRAEAGLLDACIGGIGLTT